MDKGTPNRRTGRGAKSTWREEAREAFGFKWVAALISGVILLSVGAAVTVAIRQDDSQKPIKAGADETAADVRGTGTETLQGAGSVRGIPFDPESALVAIGETGVQLRIFDGTYTCDTLLDAYRDDATWFSVDLGSSPSRLRLLPLGEVHLPESLGGTYGVTEQPGPDSDIASYNDVTGKLKLTRIDTRPGGIWRGRVVIPRLDMDGATARFSGTFAADWCGG